MTPCQVITQTKCRHVQLLKTVWTGQTGLLPVGVRTQHDVKPCKKKRTKGMFYCVDFLVREGESSVGAAFTDEKRTAVLPKQTHL